MTFVDEVKKGRFLSATCDFSLPFTVDEWNLESGNATLIHIDLRDVILNFSEYPIACRRIFEVRRM